MWLKNATILDGLFHFTPGDIRITGAYIDRVCSRGRYASEPAETLDCTGRYIIPGLIDIHTHGCNGSDASDGTPQALDNISGFLARNGITSFLPTTTTLTDELLLKALREIAAFMQRGVPGAYAHGANMEGPYLSHEKRGAHRDDWLQLPPSWTARSSSSRSPRNRRSFRWPTQARPTTPPWRRLHGARRM